MIICTKISVHFIAEVKMQKNAKSIIYYPKAVNRTPQKTDPKNTILLSFYYFFPEKMSSVVHNCFSSV